MIDANKVDEVFRDCLFRNDEIKDGKPILEPKVVDGVLNKVGFHPERILTYKEQIIGWLNELSDDFKVGKGGGMSFLNACNTKDDEQWTGMHQRMDQLFCLGMGIDKVQYQMPREMWSSLPGGMPYLAILE